MAGIYVILSQSRPRKKHKNDNSRVTTSFPKKLLGENIAQLLSCIQKWIPWPWKHRYRPKYNLCRSHSLWFMCIFAFSLNGGSLTAPYRPKLKLLDAFSISFEKNIPNFFNFSHFESPNDMLISYSFDWLRIWRPYWIFGRRKKRSP